MIFTYPLNARTTKLTASSEERSGTALLATCLHDHLWSVSFEDTSWSTTSVSWDKFATTISTSEISSRFESASSTETTTSLSLSVGLILLDKIVK